MVNIKKPPKFLNQVLSQLPHNYAQQPHYSEVKKSGIESRAALSLIASCKYQMEEFDVAARDGL